MIDSRPGGVNSLFRPAVAVPLRLARAPTWRSHHDSSSPGGLTASDQEWKLHAGTARILPASDKGIVKPLILAGKAGAGVTDLDALQARLHPTGYSFGYESTTGPADPDGLLISRAHGSRLLDHLA